MTESTPVTRALDQIGVPYRFFRHPGQVQSLEQAASERGQRPEQIIRSILFRLPDDQFIMVLTAGPAQISWQRLRAYLQSSRITMATAEQVLLTTGYPIGAVSPFGIPQPLRILLDRSILSEEEVSIGSGIRNTTIILKRDDLIQAIGSFEQGDFVEHGSS
jgi:Cys-tRNA(Pro) deacylase